MNFKVFRSEKSEQALTNRFPQKGSQLLPQAKKLPKTSLVIGILILLCFSPELLSQSSGELICWSLFLGTTIALSTFRPLASTEVPQNIKTLLFLPVSNQNYLKQEYRNSLTTYSLEYYSA